MDSTKSRRHLLTTSPTTASESLRTKIIEPLKFHKGKAPLKSSVDDEITWTNNENVTNCQYINKSSTPVFNLSDVDSNKIRHNGLSKIVLDTYKISSNLSSDSSNNESNKSCTITHMDSCADRNDVSHRDRSNNVFDNSASSSVPKNQNKDSTIKKSSVLLPSSVHLHLTDDSDLGSSLNPRPKSSNHYYPFVDTSRMPISSSETSDSYSNQNQNSESLHHKCNEKSPDLNDLEPINLKTLKKHKTSLLDSVTLHPNYKNDISSLMVSLNTTLPQRSMFYKLESKIHDYELRDPRSIIYRKSAEPMPNITNDDIDIVQRYLNK